MSMIKRIKEQLKKLPQKPGVYLFFAQGESASGGKDQDGQILYIGKAANLKKRVASHFARRIKSGLGEYFVPLIFDVDFIETGNAREALILENQLIKKYQPRFNIQWRDDKSYFWVEITDDGWPRVKTTYHLKIENCKLKIGERIGPFTNATELKQVLRALRKILPFRACKNSYEKPCLQWHLGLCPAHGLNCQSRPASVIPVKTARLPARQGIQVQNQSGFRVKPGMTEKDIKLKKYLNSLNTLRQIIRLYAGQPLRLEAYDISNIQGSYATGSLVVFENAEPKKSAYRRFRIKTVRGANDVAMLREVLKRRFGHSEWPWPDLILIDGGRAQLNAAISQISVLQATSYNLPAAIALAKREKEIYTEFSPRGLKLKKLPAFLRLIFEAARDEAHRFAITYYRKLHRYGFQKNNSQIQKAR